MNVDGSVIFGLEGDIVGNFYSFLPPSRVVRNRLKKRYQNRRVTVVGGGTPHQSIERSSAVGGRYPPSSRRWGAVPPVRVCGGVYQEI